MSIQPQGASAPLSPSAFTVRESAVIRRALTLLEAKTLREGPVLDSPWAVSSYLRLRFAGLEREELHALLLDAGGRLIEARILAVGTIDQAVCYPREVAAAALRAGAKSVILAHNHPSGRLEPSDSDLAHHQAMERALSVLDMRLLDNFVVTAQGIASIPAVLQDRRARHDAEWQQRREAEKAARAAKRAARQAANTAAVQESRHD